MIKAGVNEDLYQRFLSEKEVARKLIEEKRYEEALEVALKNIGLGLEIIDLNAAHWKNMRDNDVDKLYTMYGAASSSYRQLGDPAKAMECSAECIDIYLRIARFFDKAGEFSVAKLYFSKAHFIAVVFHGKESEACGRVHMYIGWMNYHHRWFSTAIRELTEARDIFLKLYGESHPLSIGAKRLLMTVRKHR